MLMNKKLSFLVSFTALPAVVLATGCGSSSSAPGAAITNVSVGNLPSASSMAKTNAASAAALFSNRAVSGAASAPLISSFTDDNVDTYFWGGLLNTVTVAGSATSAQKNAFFGNTVDGPGGMGACQMAQGTAESFSNLLQSANSMCYMKGLISGPTGVTVDVGTAATLFDSAATDKIIKVAVSGMQGQSAMNVFFKVYGTNTVTSDVYKADLWMCSGSTPDSVETITVTKSTGLFTDVNKSSQGDWGGSSTLTAYLKQ